MPIKKTAKTRSTKKVIPKKTAKNKRTVISNKPTVAPVSKTFVTIFPDGIITVEKLALEDADRTYVLAADGLADK